MNAEQAYFNVINERRILFQIIQEINRLNTNDEEKNIIIDSLIKDLERFKNRDDMHKIIYEKWLYDEILKEEV